jgi:hypothetical protein
MTMAAAAAVSPLLACIGSPCLRHSVHGASIGGGGGDGDHDGRLFDALVTYSSVEHAGLGRYGEALAPDADIDHNKN